MRETKQTDKFLKPNNDTSSWSSLDRLYRSLDTINYFILKCFLLYFHIISQLIYIQLD